MPRTRTDGWSVSRQCEFLVQLYVAGSVGIAAQRVRMTRASAYRLRDRADGAGFALPGTMCSRRQVRGTWCARNRIGGKWQMKSWSAARKRGWSSRSSIAEQWSVFAGNPTFPRRCDWCGGRRGRQYAKGRDHRSRPSTSF